MLTYRVNSNVILDKVSNNDLFLNEKILAYYTKLLHIKKNIFIFRKDT